MLSPTSTASVIQSVSKAGSLQPIAASLGLISQQSSESRHAERDYRWETEVMTRVSFLWSYAQMQHRRDFLLFSMAQLWRSSVGGTHISETWSIEPSCSCCFLSACSVSFTCATKAEDRSSFSPDLWLKHKPVLLSWDFSLCWMGLESHSAAHLFTFPCFTIPHPLDPSPPPHSYLSQVHHRWKWCTTCVASCSPVWAESW